MRRTEWLEENRKMRFEEVYLGWNERRLTQATAALVLGVSERTFRRYVDRYDDAGIEGLSDKRLTQVSFRRAPVEEPIRSRRPCGTVRILSSVRQPPL